MRILHHSLSEQFCGLLFTETNHLVPGNKILKSKSIYDVLCLFPSNFVLFPESSESSPLSVTSFHKTISWTVRLLIFTEMNYLLPQNKSLKFVCEMVHSFPRNFVLCSPPFQRLYFIRRFPSCLALNIYGNQSCEIIN